MTFAESFNPLNSDVIYGLSDRREAYISRYVAREVAEWDADKELQQEEPDRAKYAARVDERPTKYMSFINSYNEPITNVDFASAPPFPGLTSIALPAIQQYVKKLLGTSYSPENVKSATAVALKKSDSRLDGSFQGTDDDLRTAAGVLAIRRACKFGIEYVPFIRKGTVHYILDGINMNEVVSKTTRALYSKTTGVPITTSELRYLFRNWQKLGALSRNGSLKFWDNDLQVSAPWDHDSAPWIAYAEHLIEKQKDALKDQQVPLLAFEQKKVSDPGNALAAFFQLPIAKALLANPAYA